MIAERRTRLVALALILLIALAWRLNNLAFGLPSMWDPDEPIFMIIPLRMLNEGSFNPGWFGHPGSTVIYLVTLIDAAVAWLGLATGRYPDVAAFGHAAFANPAMLFLPARLAMALIGVGTVWLTYFIGKRLGGPIAGLIAALLLAINGLHIAWSQVVRTDIPASLFMLACILFSIRASTDGKLKDYLLAGAFAGLATVTKWPAVTVFFAVAGAAVSRGITRREVGKLTGAFAALIAAMFVASPYIFIDWRTVLANVQGEATHFHLAHTGAGFLSNLRFYMVEQVGGSMGWIGLAAELAGMVALAATSRAARWIVIPPAVAFLALICTQHLIWSRWVLPVMPAFCIFAAASAVALARALRSAVPRLNPAIAVGLTAAILAAPSLAGAVGQARERASDTRGQAARWAIDHIPPGSTVVLEHLELSLRSQPWSFRFPVGEAGCIDGLKALGAGVHLEKVQRMRGSSPIVDIGNVDPRRLGSCRADYAILTYYDLYRAESGHFPNELHNYETLLAGGRTVALFEPRLGRAGGPLVRIVALSQQ
jgi:4-amino-4-deoxy-L-arabinose transferase-like glycosyltransferase